MGRIAVRGLGKAYKFYPNRGARLAEWLWPFGAPRHSLRWVLKDIDFEVAPGRALGIIGINGAGKSTLLKMITGTTQPTAGRVELSGRVAALLELGMGFHPDFTGRQNAVMASQLLGLATHEIESLMPGIEAFAEVGDWIDQPVRTWSSGMQMRLAFSVATAVRPDVLIVDEALSVGDAYFQHKSFERIRAFRSQGTTLLIVSHDKAAIQSICDEAILLDGGRLAMQGDPEAVMDYYNALIAQREHDTVKQDAGEDGKLKTVSGTGEATIASVRLLDAQGTPAEVVAVGAAATLEVRVQAHAALDSLVVGYMIKNRLGQPVFGTNTHHLREVAHGLEPGDALVLRFDFPMALGPGSYSIAVAAHRDRTHVGGNYEWRDRVLMFEVINQGLPHFEGMAHLPVRVTVDREVSA